MRNYFKIYLLFCFAIVLAACSTDSETATEIVTDELVPVEFSTSTVTRASSSYVTGTDFGYRSHIGVFAYYTGSAAWSSSAIPNFMYNQMVERQANGSWLYAPLKYWPNQQNDKVTFWGYYPHGGTGVTVGGSNATAGLPVFSFEVQPYSKDQVDFMFSNIVTNEMHVTSERTTATNYRVALTFRHALSKIVLKVVDDNDLDAFSKPKPLAFTATLSDWYDQGDCRSTTSNTVNWSSRVRGGTEFSTEGAENDAQRCLLMIPGSLRGTGEDAGNGTLDATLQFRYILNGVPFFSDVCHLNATGTSTPEDDSDDLDEWEAGKTYTYTYHVDQRGNYLSIAVNPWYQVGMVFDN